VPNLADLQILVVDDDQFMRGLIEEILASFGISATMNADCGERGLHLVSTCMPDVVLCDIEMSPMSGIELLRRIRNHPDMKLRATQVIMLTGHAHKALVDEARRLRANGYLVKPISPELLKARLDAAAAEKSRLEAAASGLKSAP
jgi:two-component system chemotaxis response regulator CheY